MRSLSDIVFVYIRLGLLSGVSLLLPLQSLNPLLRTHILPIPSPRRINLHSIRRNQQEREHRQRNQQLARCLLRDNQPSLHPSGLGITYRFPTRRIPCRLLPPNKILNDLTCRKFACALEHRITLLSHVPVTRALSDVDAVDVYVNSGYETREESYECK